MPMQSDYKELGLAPRPFVTYTHQPNFKSPCVRTGPLGFREQYTCDGVPIDLRRLRSRYPECRLLLGGSVAFGIGASSDRNTMAALLWQPELPFVNLGISASATQQELAYYLSLRHLLPPVRDVVLYSGFNDCVHAGMSEATVFDHFGGTVLGEQRCPPPAPGPVRRFVQQRILRRTDAPQDEWSRSEVEDNLIPPDFVEARWRITLGRTARNLEIWRALQDAFDMRVHYVLQPAMGWTSKRLTADEQADWDYDTVHLGKAGRWLRSAPVYQRARAELSAAAAENGIRFYDANEWLAEGYDDVTIFIDVAHYCDEGQRIMATELDKNLDWK